MKINLTGYTKYAGDARRLEDAACEASSALPLIFSTLNTSRELLEFFSDKLTVKNCCET